jgi:hypothetical protein
LGSTDRFLRQQPFAAGEMRIGCREKLSSAHAPIKAAVERRLLNDLGTSSEAVANFRLRAARVSNAQLCAADGYEQFRALLRLATLTRS